MTASASKSPQTHGKPASNLSKPDAPEQLFKHCKLMRQNRK
jgi:hypothetical protein